MWLPDCNLLWEHSSLSYFVRRSDFQAKILKYWKILLKISKDSCCFTKYIRMPMQSLAADVFLKDMNFYRHEFLLSYLAVRITNHIIIFLSDFPFPSNYFYGFEEQLIWNFQKFTIKKQRDGVYILLRPRLQVLRQFLWNFLGFPELIIRRATVNDCFWTFKYFFPKLLHLCQLNLWAYNFPEFRKFWSVWQK